MTTPVLHIGVPCEDFRTELGDGHLSSIGHTGKITPHVMLAITWTSSHS